MSETIDVELFNKYFPIEFRKEIQDHRHKFLNDIKYADIEGNTGKYQCNLIKYGDRHSHLPEELRNIDDLYPPNFAILDFMLKNLDKVKNYTHLDHACGLGILSIYLNKLGIKCYNYDNWSQFITKEHTKDFLSNYGLSHTVIDREEAITLSADMFSSIGYWANSEEFDPNVKYVFSDTNYPTSIVKSINNRVVYDNLIIISII